MIIFAVFFLLVYFNPCHACKTVLLNEINSHTVRGHANNEFLELIGLQCTATSSLKQYTVLIITAFDKKADGPAVVFSADLFSKSFDYKEDNDRQLFVIGAGAKANMKFDDDMVGFIDKEKRVAKDQSQLTSFFKKSGVIDDAIDDGDLTANALLLIRFDRQLNEKNTQMNSLKINYRDSNRKLVTRPDPIAVTPPLQEFIRNHLVDAIFYSKKADFVAIPFFHDLLPTRIQETTTDYDIRPGFEWDGEKKERSISRCPKNSYPPKAFEFSSYKLAPATPGLPNQCDVAFRYILVDRAMDIQHEEVDEGCEESDDPSCTPAKRLRVESSVIEEDVTMIDLTKSAEDDKNEELYNKLTSQLTCQLNNQFENMLNLLRKRLHVAPSTCPVKEDSTPYPWNDRSHWLPEHDRLLRVAFEGNLKLTNAQKAWIEIISTADEKNPNFRCKLCFGHAKRNEGIIDTKILGDFAREEGAHYNQLSVHDKARYWQKRFSEHVKGHVHHTRIIMNMQKAMQMSSQKCVEGIDDGLEEETKITAKVFKTAYMCITRHISFRIFPDLITLQQNNGALPAELYHKNRKAFSQMVHTMASNMHQSLLTTLKNHNPPISIIVDSSSDAQSHDFLLVFFQFTYELKPVVHLYAVLQLSNGNAESMHDEIIKEFRKDGIEDVVRKNLVAFVADGAASMQGKKSGLGARFDKWMKEPPFDAFIKPGLFTVHCHSHRLQLAISYAMKNNVHFEELHEDFESTVNAIYAFYGKHAVKRMSSLEAFAESYSVDLYRVKGSFKVRWISSQYIACWTLKQNYFVILYHLKQIKGSKKEFDKATRTKAEQYYKKLSTLDFYIYLLFTLDALEPARILSLSLQKDKYSITRLQVDLDETLSQYEKMKTAYGSEVSKFLRDAKCKENEAIVPCDVEKFDNKETYEVSLKLHNYFPYRSPEKILFFTRDEEELHLNNVRNFLIPALHQKIKDNFPESADVLKQLSMLEPNEVPEGTATVELYCTQFKYLVKRFGGASERIRAQCIDVLKHMIQNDFSTFSTLRGTTMQEFWSYSIKSAKKDWQVGDLQRLIESVMATAPGSVVVERAFSVFFYTKTSRRSLLSVVSLNDMMKLLVDGPEPSAYDPLPAVVKWIADGHRHSGKMVAVIDPNTQLDMVPAPPTERFLDDSIEFAEIELDDGSIDDNAIDSAENADILPFLEDAEGNHNVFPVNDL